MQNTTESTLNIALACQYPDRRDSIRLAEALNLYFKEMGLRVVVHRRDIDNVPLAHERWSWDAVLFVRGTMSALRAKVEKSLPKTCFVNTIFLERSSWGAWFTNFQKFREERQLPIPKLSGTLPTEKGEPTEASPEVEAEVPREEVPQEGAPSEVKEGFGGYSREDLETLYRLAEEELVSFRAKQDSLLAAVTHLQQAFELSEVELKRARAAGSEAEKGLRHTQTLYGEAMQQVQAKQAALEASETRIREASAGLSSAQESNRKLAEGIQQLHADLHSAREHFAEELKAAKAGAAPDGCLVIPRDHLEFIRAGRSSGFLSADELLDKLLRPKALSQRSRGGFF